MKLFVRSNPFNRKPAGRTQAMVEFALIMPLLMLLIYGILEVGRLVFEYSSVVTASREAARYGAASGLVSSANQYKDCAGIVAAAQRVDFLGAIDDSNITIRYYDSTDTLINPPGTIYGNACQTGPTVPSGGRIEITVTASFTPLSGLVPLNPMTLASQSSRTILGAVQVSGADAPESIGAPSMIKAFANPSIKVGETTTLTFTLTNPNFQDLTGVSFRDDFPTGMIVASPPASSQCGGTVTYGANWVQLDGGTLGPFGECTVTVSVTTTVAGSYINSSRASSSEGGPGDIVYAPPLASVAAPVIWKGFLDNPIQMNGTSRLVITITNPSANTEALTGVAFTDNLIAATPGLQVAASPNASTGGCGSPTFAPAAGATSLSFSGATIGVGATCTINVTVTATINGLKKNTSGSVGSTNGGAGNTAYAELTVIGPLTIGKSFAPATIAKGGPSTLTFTVTNPNTVSVGGVTFTDTFPSGVQVASPPTTSCGGTVSSTSNSVSLVGGMLAAGPSTNCTVTVSVTAITGGAKPNTSGPIKSSDTADGNTATATLNVVSPPVISKAFVPNTIPVNGTSKLTFTIANPPENPIPLTGVQFDDTLLADVKVAGTPGVSYSGCSAGAFLSATANTTLLQFRNGTIAVGGTCTINVNVTATSGGSKPNTSGAVTSTNPSNNGNTASATLSVVSGLFINKSFSPDTINVNGTSTLTFTITNPTGVSISTVAFTDTFPAGMARASTPATPRCGGTVGSTANSISLSGGTVGANSSCTVTINVTATTGGALVNTSGAITYGSPTSTGNTASATLTVTSPPTISKAFSPSTIAANAISTLTFTITNPAANTVDLTGVAFGDTFPANLKVATPPNAVTANCGSPAFAPLANAISLSFTGGSIPVGGACTVSVSVTPTTDGTKTNTSGNVSSTNGGTGGNTGPVILTVNPMPPSIGKAFSGPTLALGGTSTLTFTITNPNPSTTLTGVGFTDIYPGGMTSTNTPTTTCGGSFTGSTTLKIVFSGGTINGGATCTVTVSITTSSAGNYVNTSEAVTSTNGGTGNTATASLVTVAPPVIGKAFLPIEIALAGQTTLTFTITNPPGNTVPLTGVGFTDPLPTGLPVSNTPNASTSGCGTPTFSPTAGASTLTFSGGTIAVGGTCTVSVSLTATIEGTKTNTSGAVTSTNGGSGNTASATLKVNAAPPAVSPPSISKSFAPATISKNGTSLLTFVITNPNSDNVLAGIAFNDNFTGQAAGIQVASPPNASFSGCGTPTYAPVAGDTSISFTDGLIAAGSLCVVRVDVTATNFTPSQKVNTTSNVSATNSKDPGLPAIATLTVTVRCDATTVTHTAITTPGSTMVMDITNGTGAPLTITNIFVKWNSTDGHQTGGDKTLKLKQIQLGSQSQAFASPYLPGPNYTFTPSPSWALPILPSTTSILTFTFHQSYDNESGEQIKVYFSTPGCENFSPLVAP